MRRHWVDNLRTSVVLLVVVYHVCYAFNGVGIPGGIPGSQNIPFLDSAAALVYPWFMVLMFMIAGMSSAYSLEKRSAGEFLKSRTDKLLVPSTIGLFVLHFWTGYVNMHAGSAPLDGVPGPIIYLIAALSGSGPLWFAQLLWLYSVLLLLFRKTGLPDKVRRSEKKSVLFPVILIYLSSLVLNMPVITVFRIGIYGVAFFTGYMVFSDDRMMDRVEKLLPLTFAVSLISAVLYILKFRGLNFTSDQCLHSVITNIYAYFMSLLLMGLYRKYMDRTSPVLSCLSSSSFGVYVLHYPPLITSAWLVTRSGMNVWLCYLITLISGFAGAFLLYEVIRRIPVYRYLVLGIRKGS
ncbi:MAG: acyltransferase family protein [Bullifex sp.]